MRVALISAMRDLQQELFDESMQNLSTNEGKEGLQKEEITEVANVIVATIVGDAWTVMDEWGKGSEMDVLNPALTDYMSGELWNPLRSSTIIVGRPRGWYTNIFGERVYSSGFYAGRGMENESPPNPPSHAIKTAARWMQNGRFAERIRTEVKSFPFHKFFIVDMK